MTNGEKMISAFPNGEVRMCEKGVVFSTGGWCHAYADEWWNAEYKGPTTKNDCAEQNGCITCSLDDGDDCCRKLYEESMQESTTKNNLADDCISRADARSLICKIDRKYMFCMSGKAFQDLYKGIDELPSVIPFSSELEKNSKKLEKDFGELDCISRADAIKAMQDKAKKLKNEDTINGLCGAVAILYEMPSVTPQLSVPEVTALAEWTTKLIEADKSAYSQGYADGMKIQKPRKGHWIYIRNSEVNGLKIVKCSECGKRTYGSGKYCPNCGADMREVEE